MRIPARIIALLPSLGRENEHEVVATARAIERALKSEGLDWYALADALRPASTSPCTANASFVDLARACRDRDGGRLSPRERGFLVDICARGVTWRLTPKQSAWLQAIAERLDLRAAA